jgi:hypothetical protein
MFIRKSIHNTEVSRLKQTIAILEEALEKLRHPATTIPTQVAFDFTQVVNVFSIERSADGESILGWPSTQPGEHTEWRLPTTPDQHAALITAWKATKPGGTVV